MAARETLLEINCPIEFGYWEHDVSRGTSTFVGEVSFWISHPSLPMLRPTYMDRPWRWLFGHPLVSCLYPQRSDPPFILLISLRLLGSSTLVARVGFSTRLGRALLRVIRVKILGRRVQRPLFNYILVKIIWMTIMFDQYISYVRHLLLFKL